MPWTVDDPPAVAKNKSPKEKRACVSAANSAKARGESDSKAIQACIGAMKKAKNNRESNAMDDSILSQGMQSLSQGMQSLLDTEQPVEMGAKENAAQQARSKRYGIQIRDDGNVTKPAKWERLSDSQFSDPVNYLYPVPDKSHAENAKSRFSQNKSKYDERSRAVVRRRINRLCRKYGVDPLEQDDDHEESMNKAFLVGEIMLAKDEEMEEDDPHKGMFRIPAARPATLNRQIWFWNIEIVLDSDLFESFIDNWQTDVVGNKLFIADGHRHDREAMAWIEDIQIEDDNLVLYADPTAMGEGILGDSYKYASIWYTDNFKDQETGIEYGPTLLGCAATNIPFVHRQEPMSMVLDNLPQGGTINYFIFPNEHMFSGANTGFTPVANSNLIPEVEEPEDDAGSDQTQEEEQAMTEETKVTSPQSLKVGDKEFSAEDIMRILGEHQQSQAREAELEQVLQESRVSEFCDKASARGVAPIVVQIARQVMMACDMVAEPTILLTVSEDGQARDEKVNLFNAVAKLLSVVPGRIGNTPELTYTKHDARPEDKPAAKTRADILYTRGKENMTPEEAEALACERRKELKGGVQVEAPEI